MVTLVLPEPERGAPMMIARAVISVPRSFSRIDTMPPMTIRAGEITFSRAAVSTSVPSVATITRSCGMVAFSTSAAGVSPGSPPARKSATVAAMCVSPI